MIVNTEATSLPARGINCHARRAATRSWFAETFRSTREPRMKDDVTAADATSFETVENVGTFFDENCANMRIMQAHRSRFVELRFSAMDESFIALKIASPSSGKISGVCGPFIPSEAFEKSDSPMFCLVEGNKVADRGGGDFKLVPNASTCCAYKPTSNMMFMHVCHCLMLQLENASCTFLPRSLNDACGRGKMFGWRLSEFST